MPIADSLFLEAHYSTHELGQPFGLPKERVFGIRIAKRKVPLDGTGVERRKVWRGLRSVSADSSMRVGVLCSRYATCPLGTLIHQRHLSRLGG